MGFSKEEKSRRVLKTVFFLITMGISFLVFSAPVFLVLADAILPSALLSASISPSYLSVKALRSYFDNYDFRSSLIDIPIISITRSAVIICVYSLCDGPKLSKGPYLGITMICSISSLVFVSLKASFVFSSRIPREGYVTIPEAALFISSWTLAIAHIIVAYRTSCRERRKLLVYKIDIEAYVFKLCTDFSLQEWVSNLPTKDPSTRKSKVNAGLLTMTIYLCFWLITSFFARFQVQPSQQ